MRRDADAYVLRGGMRRLRDQLRQLGPDQFVAAPRTGDVAPSSVLLSGAGDPGYHFTAVGLAETALEILPPAG